VIEDDPGFAELKDPSTGVLAWPALRTIVLRMLLGDMLYPTSPLVDLGRRRSLGRRITNEVRVRIHNREHPFEHAEVLILGTGAGLFPRGHALFNRYTDYFSGLLGPRAWSVESLYGHVWPPLPRSNGRLSLLSDHRLIATPIEGRRPASRAQRAIVDGVVELVIDRGRHLLGWDLDRDRRTTLHKVGRRLLAMYPAQAEFAQGVLNRIRPRLVLAEEGCYGRMAVFNSVARDFGITVAEFQHGMITRGHDAYNVGSLLRSSSAYATTQPGAFLSYGSWWQDQFNAPVEQRIAIGYPHRIESIRNWRPSPERNDVLVLGDSTETPAYLSFCRELITCLSRPLRVVFRPHPLERHRVSGVHEPGLHIDLNPDLYMSLSSACAVIGEVSTGLFEGVGLAERVFVWDTPKSRFYLGNHTFRTVSGPEEVRQELNKPQSEPNGAAEAIWATDWSTALLDFLSAA
jgi:hypothetical protein